MLACRLPLSSFLLLCLAISTFGDTLLDENTADGMILSGKTAAAAGHSNSTLGPGSIPFDVDGYPVPPPELELEQVHLYVRHGEPFILLVLCSSPLSPLLLTGERTPVRVRMSEPPASIPARWELCKAAQQFRAAVTSNLNSSVVEDLPVRRVVEREDGSVVDGEW